MSRNYGAAQPLARQHMPTGYDISFRDYSNNRTVRIPKDFGPKQSLRGFEPEYANIVDYIVRITHRIWESKPPQVEYIADCYGPTSLIYDDYGLQTGNKKIIADTHHTTGAFPDIILDAEEIIWAGDDEVGFHTSHLTRIIGKNTGPSRYGPSTDKDVSVMVIANCVALQNDIFLEHVLYNTSAMLQQLGIDLWEEAERLASDPPAGWPRSPQIWDDLRKSAVPDQPLSQGQPVYGFDPDSFTRRLHDNIWNGDMSVLDTEYAADMPFEGTTERKFSGVSVYKAYVQSLRDAFSDLSLQVDEVYWMGNDADGWLISTRWSAETTHSGDTETYRAATGAACQIWGITQWRVRDGRVEQEWQLFNELDLMMQIAKARQDAA
ncbi:nuclear transport factor 2 family protein [Ruegeria atlantica]|uniref:Putative ester cyclase n=1 Tax=Ruegeria atlantica TaxID=81569 RepID=A0A0P1ED58_9RHOB|nr:ester cyclase [Ruegeria atlantica]CUH47181.1 putative ester cyclase [Ruegeria atlantica]